MFKPKFFFKLEILQKMDEFETPPPPLFTPSHHVFPLLVVITIIRADHNTTNSQLESDDFSSFEPPNSFNSKQFQLKNRKLQKLWRHFLAPT